MILYHFFSDLKRGRFLIILLYSKTPPAGQREARERHLEVFLRRLDIVFVPAIPSACSPFWYWYFLTAS